MIKKNIVNIVSLPLVPVRIKGVQLTQTTSGFHFQGQEPLFERSLNKGL